MTRQIPDWTYEARHNHGPVCGVDEAGRGPLAGPVVASAVILDPHNIPDGLNDSKALSDRQRTKLYQTIISSAHVGIGLAEPEEIDRLNILQATMIAMNRAVKALPILPHIALIDGNRMPPMPCKAQTIIKGDRKSLSIAAASIIAKVTRDHLMVVAEARFPGYGLAQHKGYPTAYHKTQLSRLGPSPIHRHSFAPVRQACVSNPTKQQS